MRQSQLFGIVIVLTALFLIAPHPASAQVSQGPVVIQDGGTGVTQASVKAAGVVTPNVIGVQGNASGVPIPVSVSGGSGTTANQGTPGTTAWPITPTIGTAVTDYAGTGVTVMTLSATSGTVVTANTLTIIALRCNNTTSGAVTVNWTDTAGNSFDTNFSIPANSNYYAVSPGSLIKVVGLKMWAGAVSSINCIITAKQ